MLSTCNRLALVLETGPDAGPGTAADQGPDVEDQQHGPAGAVQDPGRGACPLALAVAELLTRRAGLPAGSLSLTEATGRAAHRELFATACGLRSMVVGERQIAGQLRRAQRTAAQEGTLSTPIIRAVERASIVSRRVAAETSLAGRGRSVVAVGLDLAGRHLPGPRQCRVLIVGTGSYAGATVTALRDRGVGSISVYSATDRARVFAQERGLRAVEPGGLDRALMRADLVITCRGLGIPVLTTRLMEDLEPRRGERGLVVLDLALTRDVEPDVGLLPGITRIDLDHVQAAVPRAATGEVEAAWRIVEEETADFEQCLAGRRMDSLIAGLRSRVGRAVAEEAARLRPVAPVGGDGAGAGPDPLAGAAAPGGGPEPVVTLAQAERALHRLAARLLHEPTVAARRAGRAGQQEAYREALSLVIGSGLVNSDTDRNLAS